MPDPDYLIDQYLDDDLNADEAIALNAWIKASPENAKTFMRRAWLHRQVYDRMVVADLQRLAREREAEVAIEDEGQASGPATLADMELLLQGSDAGRIVDITDEMIRREQAKADRQRRISERTNVNHDAPDAVRTLVIPKWLVYGVAAMLLIAGAVGLNALFSGTAPAPPDQQAQLHAPDSAPLPPVVARLSQRNEYAVFVSAPADDGLIRKGQQIELISGIAEFTFETGVVARFQGPAVIGFEGENATRLTRGLMTAAVPAQGKGFTVDTPGMRVVDLGTEFGVSVFDDKPSEVHVFVGEVTAAPIAGDGQHGEPISLLASHGLSVNRATGQTTALKADGAAFASVAPHVALLYRNLVINGDFEQGGTARVVGKTLDDVINLPVPGWEDAGPGTVLGYDEASAFDYPNPAVHAVPADRGNAYYAGMQVGMIRQAIDVSPLAHQIDAGQIALDLSADLGGFEDNTEYIQVRARFLGDQGQPIGEAVELQPVHALDRGDATGFVSRQLEDAVPAGTRRVVIELENIGEIAPPFVIDGYADNIALRLSVN